MQLAGPKRGRSLPPDTLVKKDGTKDGKASEALPAICDGLAQGEGPGQRASGKRSDARGRGRSGLRSAATRTSTGARVGSPPKDMSPNRLSRFRTPEVVRRRRRARSGSVGPGAPTPPPAPPPHRDGMSEPRPRALEPGDTRRCALPREGQEWWLELLREVSWSEQRRPKVEGHGDTVGLHWRRRYGTSNPPYISIYLRHSHRQTNPTRVFFRSMASEKMSD